MVLLSSAAAVGYIVANPLHAAAIGTAAACVTIAAAPAIVASPALSIVGFAADGIAKGSIAAGVQSGIGNVIAPSLFATLQSAGAAGYGAAAVSGVVSAAAGVTGALVAGVAYLL